MRLLTKITLSYLAVSFLVLLTGGIIIFKLIKHEIDKEHHFYLENQLKVITKSIEKGIRVDNLEDEKVQITPLGKNANETEVTFSDTLVWHPYLEREETNLKLQTVRKIGDAFYQISIHDVIVESDDITEAARGSVISIFILLLVAILIFSVFFSKWIFRPFDETLEKIKSFRLASNEALELKPTETNEFAKLNDFLKQMTSKSKKDYFNLKRFNENASHEMQTPLAIARGKIELLMESENLSEEEKKLVNAAHNSILKLSRLGKSLSLISKIENQEFANFEKINFTEVIKKVLKNFEELIELKSIQLKTDLESNVRGKMDPVLADILLTNLLQNSIKHNHQGGMIAITLSQKILEIVNTGNPPEVPPSELFERFKKSQNNHDSLGLGLSIVREICDLSGLDIAYNYIDKYHRIRVSLSLIKEKTHYEEIG